MARERVSMNRLVAGSDVSGPVAMYGVGEAYSDRYGSEVSASAGVEFNVRMRLEAAGVMAPPSVSMAFSLHRAGRRWMVRGGPGDEFVADNLRGVALAVREKALWAYLPGLKAALVRYVPADRMVALMAGGGV